MDLFENVRATERPEEIEIDEYSVYVNENIREVEVSFENESHVEFEFEQKRYGKDEYIKMLSEKNARLEQAITDTQLALCEIYESEVVNNG